MSDMIERVARALCVADGKNPDADWRDQGTVTLSVAVRNPETWRRYVKPASAAIDAMDRDEWKPIATAPKNGQKILVCVVNPHGHERHAIARWHRSAVREGWDILDGDNESRSDTITCWAELPFLPSTRG